MRFLPFWIVAVAFLAAGPAEAGIFRKGGTPDWVKQRSGPTLENGQRSIYGVGAIASLRNRTLAVSRADERAKAEVSAQVQRYLSSLLSIGPSEGGRDGDVALVAAIEAACRKGVDGAVIVDRWYDSAVDVQFSLARLEWDGFKRSLDASTELDDRIRRAVALKGDEVFDRLRSKSHSR